MAHSVQPSCKLSDFYSVFQEKHTETGRRQSKGQEDIRTWDTNCPDNVPTPPLFPGELVQLKQHRILCVGSTEIPLIGSLFVTNYRLIFTGNPINGSSQYRECLDFTEGQSKATFSITATKTLGRESGKILRKARNLAQKRTEEARNSPLPSRSPLTQSDNEASETSGRERAVTTARNFIKGLRQTLRGNRSATDIEKEQTATNETEEGDVDSNESGSIHSLSPLSRPRADGVDFERVPAEYSQEDFVSTSSEEEEFDDVTLDVQGPEDELKSEEMDSEPLLLRKEISRHLTTSVSLRSHLSASSQHYMNFSVMTGPMPRSSMHLATNKAPVPSPRGVVKSSPLSVKSVQSPQSPEESLLRSYDKDTDSEDDTSVRKEKVCDRRNDSTTLTPGSKLGLSGTSTLTPTSTLQLPCESSSKSTSLKSASRRTLPSSWEKETNRGKSSGKAMSTSSESAESKLGPEYHQNGTHGHATQSSLLGQKGKTPPPPTAHPIGSSDMTQSTPNSRDPPPSQSSVRRFNTGPPPAPPKKPSVMNLQAVDGLEKLPVGTDDSRSGRTATQSTSDGRTGATCAGDHSSEESRKAGVDTSSEGPGSERSMADRKSESTRSDSQSRSDDDRMGQPSSSASIQARIRELSTYENFLPLAWRSKPVKKADAIEEEPEREEPFERTTLSRSLRIRKFFGSMKGHSPENDLRKSMTLPQFGDTRQFTPVLPVSYSEQLWCLTKAISQVRLIQSSTLLSDSDVPITPGQGVHVMCWNFNSLKLYVHPNNTYDAEKLKKILEEDVLKRRALEKQYAFKYRKGVMVDLGPRYLSFVHEKNKLTNSFNMNDEAKRLGFLSSPLWTVSDFLECQQDVCPSYPGEVIVPRPTPLVDIARAAPFFKDNRFPVATWRSTANGAILLRGAAAAGKRGSSGSKDEQALLQQICGCLEGPDDIKLYAFTEKKQDINLKYVYNTQQQEAYYYSGVKFVYVDRLPTHKTLRGNFNKLFHFLEQSESHSGCLSVLENTGWFHRISDLLALSSEVCALISEAGSSVLVAYESGWDITTQVVSLSQLLLDPYYRTMEGFQILVQKEWLAFGHPFAARHGNHADRPGEEGPVFLQWVDCVWQISQQCPSVFEFNTLFLETLVDHSYSGMFGTFLTDTCRERQKTEETVPFWTFVEICNRKDHRFLNKIYDKNLYPGVLYVQFEVHCMKLWTSYYCRLRHWGTSHSLAADLESMMALYQELRSKVLRLEAGLPKTSQNEDILPSSSTNSDLHESTQYELVPIAAVVSSNKKATQDILSKHRPSKSLVISNLSEYLKSRGIDPDIAYHVELHRMTCSGYLVKLGGRVRSWKTRWFVLDVNRGYFCYFKNHEAFCNKADPKGVINLQDVQDVYQTNKEDHLKNHVFLLMTPQRTYYIRASTLPTLQLWMTLLEIPLHNKPKS